MARLKRALPFSIIKYYLLVSFGFVFLYPILYMASYSLMDLPDLRSPFVNYIPTKLDFNNYNAAFTALNYWNALWTSIYVSFLPAAAQSVTACVTAYGLARFQFPGKRFIFGLVIAAFIIPPSITMLPQFMIYRDLGLIDTPFAFIIPATFGQGIRSSILILVFYQIINTIPVSLDESALIDGAGPYKMFARIALPLASAGFVISFLFSLIWYWNETTLSTLYMGNRITTLPMQLDRFAIVYNRMLAGRTMQGEKSLNVATYMAGTMLNVLPLLVFYFFTQKQFVQSVDRSGITGE